MIKCVPKNKYKLPRTASACGALAVTRQRTICIAEATNIVGSRSRPHAVPVNGGSEGVLKSFTARCMNMIPLIAADALKKDSSIAL